MSFVKKEWKDRIAEYINRRMLVKEDGSSELVTVERNEGTISVEGDAFNAETMNDLEERIDNALKELSTDTLHIIDARSAEYDMDVILKSGYHMGLYSTNVSTLGTPSKYGVTDRVSALILSYASNSGYGEQIAFVSGGDTYERSLNERVIGIWHKRITQKDVVDNLESTAKDKPLSANQGKVLDEKFSIKECELLLTLTNAEEGTHNIDFSKYKKVAIETGAGHYSIVEIDMNMVRAKGDNYYFSDTIFHGTSYNISIWGYITDTKIHFSGIIITGWTFSHIKVYGFY